MLVFDNIEQWRAAWNLSNGARPHLIHGATRVVVQLPPSRVFVQSRPEVFKCDRPHAAAVEPLSSAAAGIVRTAARKSAIQSLVETHGRLGYRHDAKLAPASTYQILPPLELSLNTAVAATTVLRTHLESIVAAERESGRAPTAFVPVVVDGLLFLMLSRCIESTQKLSLDLWNRVVLIPGPFHFYWHVLIAIFQLWGPWLLSWAHRQLGRQPGAFDWGAKRYTQAHALLETVTTALLLWFVSSGLSQKTEQALFQQFESDEVLTNALRFLLYSALPYFRLRALIRSPEGKADEIRSLMLYFLGHFAATRKWNYIEVVTRFEATLAQLQPDAAEYVLEHCLVVRLYEGKHNGKGADDLAEHVRLFLRFFFPVANRRVTERFFFFSFFLSRSLSLDMYTLCSFCR